MEENKHWAYEYGWKDGYEWILSELLINKKISQKHFKKYMNYLYDVRKKVYNYFESVHPVFGNRYNITNKEAFYTGMQIAKAKENNK